MSYDEGIHKPLLDALEQLIPADRQPAQIAINYSKSDDKADGLSHGMYLLLEEYLQGTRFALVSAEEILGALRARKTPEEISRVRSAIAETERLFDAVPSFAVEGRSEREIYDFIQERIDAAGRR